ncbi:mechanosensitive ion channel family protein [Galbibacter mesophilus]|uniref:mechanosensitive ion channel family protein n=1 Tax=Galbibacter mesophilus TaxID=379069 RepID=UPI00191E0EDD|nr:mechanosensitive ion channel domain-containing protein [Galbibacter mesophilus]MCM5661858.1 mechanosensitive ion channel [Galbibacter mesophilus]
MQTEEVLSQSEKWLNQGIELVMEYGPKVVGAILIWIIGSFVFSRILKFIDKIMERRAYDLSVREFLSSLLYWAFKVVLIVVILGTLGIETTSLAAILASVGLAVGLALQGSLANFAGGVLLLIFKPFKVGDWIEAQGVSGTVKEIGIVNTVLNTFGNQQAIIPNGKLSNDNIVNYSAEPIRRENIVAGISYDSDIRKAKDILMDIITTHPKILNEPKPEVMVAALADSSVNLNVRYWANNPDFFACKWYVTEEIKKRFDAEGIEIPYPHQVEIQKNA